MTRLVVLVNGLPGSGKSTLVRSLAAELDWPFVSKDVIKETLFDTLGHADREWSRQLGRAAAESMWSVLAGIGCNVLVEGVFAPYDRELTLAGLQRAGVQRVAEVVCDCPPEEALRRFWQRVEAGERHPGHAQSPGEWDKQDQHAWDRLFAEPIEVGLGPVLRVDTTRPVDVAEVATWVRGQL